MSANRRLRHEERRRGHDVRRTMPKTPLADSNTMSPLSSYHGNMATTTFAGSGTTTSSRRREAPSTSVLKAASSSNSSSHASNRHGTNRSKQQQQQQQQQLFSANFEGAWDAQDASWEAILDNSMERKETVDNPFHLAPATSAAASQQESSGRMSRSIKSLFQSRAAAAAAADTPTVPLSPDHSKTSSSSSAYVGWPGTQDATGRTVPQIRSYDDSCTSLEHSKAEQQISRWTAQTSAETEDDDDFSSVGSFPSPIRAEPSHRERTSTEQQQLRLHEDSHPRSVTEFNLQAAAADATARASASSSLSAMQYQAEQLQQQHQPPRQHQQRAALGSDGLRHALPLLRRHTTTTTTGSGSTENDCGDLRQTIPLVRSSTSRVSSSRSAISLTNGSNLARNQGRTLPDSATTPSFQLAQRASRRQREHTPPRGGSRDLSPGADAVRFGQGEYGSTTSSSPGGRGGGSEASASALSKTSSAYLDTALDYPELLLHKTHRLDPAAVSSLRDPPETAFPAATAAPYNPYGGRQSSQAVAQTSIRALDTTAPLSQPPTKDALLRNEQHLTPHRNFATPTTKGYSGLLDKTKMVPSLMDDLDESDSTSSKASAISSGQPSPTKAGGRRLQDISREKRISFRNDDDTVSDVFDGISAKDSDVFDNVSHGDVSRQSALRNKNAATRQSASYPERIAEEDGYEVPPENFNVVALGGGLTAIQTTEHDYRHRRTADDYDDHLSTSDVSSNGHTMVPGFHEMVSAGKSHDSALRGIDGNLGKRSLAKSSPTDAQDVYNDDEQESASGGSSHSGSSSGQSSHGTSLFTDPYKSDGEFDVAGDLSEYYVQPSVMKKVLRKYRSISGLASTDLDFCEYEKDEDERKAFALFEMRSRIMEKDIERGLERRGGTYAVDDLVVTPFNRTAHRIRDAVIVSKAWRDGATISDVTSAALLTRRAEHSYFIKRPVKDNTSSRRPSTSRRQRYTWEAVRWLDDADFMQYRCPSFGARHMRGFEMFTIGDCQSILLKLTNERCLELRGQLNEATARQIEAEELLKEEGDNFDGMMSEAEMTYLGAMEEVKTISKSLVSAEQAFALVRERIEKLYQKIESMLMKIETESFAGASSVVSSYYSEYESSEAYWEQEDRLWARRAKRAEIRAEISAREALMAKQQARMIQEEKVREVEALKNKLEELQSEYSAGVPAREKAAAVKSLGTHRAAYNNSDPARDSPPSSVHSISKEKLDDVKQRFRDRMAARKQQPEITPRMGRAPLYPSQKQHKAVLPPSPSVIAERELLRSAGEEMCQQMDFYERSLKAVDSARGYK